MAASMHVGDVGTVLTLGVTDEAGSVVNLAGFLSLRLHFRRPDKSVQVRDCGLASDGTDGIARYTIVYGDLTVKGKYKFQVVVELSSGIWHSDIQERTVEDNLDGG